MPSQRPVPLAGVAKAGVARAAVVRAALVSALFSLSAGVAPASTAGANPRAEGSSCEAGITGTTLCVTSTINGHFGGQPPGTWTSTSFDDAVAVSSHVGYVAGARCSAKGCSGLLGATNDAGRHWSFRPTGDVLPAAVDFASPGVGFLVGRAGEGTARRSPDVAGVDGEPCSYGGGDMPACTVLLGTDDGGQDWSPSGHDLGQIWAMTFLSPAQGFLALTHCRTLAGGEGAFPPGGCRGDVEATDNGGASWHPVLATKGPVLALAAAGRRVWAVEANFAASTGKGVGPGSLRLWRSNDAGASWSKEATLAGDQLPAPLNGDLDVQLQFASPSVGAMVLFASSSCAMHGCGLDDLFTTHDGGRTWTLAQLPGAHDLACGQSIDGLGVSPGDRLVVETSFPSASCPAYPAGVALSTDGGRRWTPARTFGFGPFVSSMALPTPAVGWGVDGGSIMATSDGGVRWRQTWPAPTPSEGTDLLTPSFGYGLGDQSDDGAVLVTADAGRSWRQVASLGVQLAELDFTGASSGWALAFSRPLGGGGAELLVTDDGGRSWATVPFPPPAALALTSVQGNQPGAELSLLHAGPARSASILVPQRVGPDGSTVLPPTLLFTSDAGHHWRQTALARWAGGVVAASSAGGPGIGSSANESAWLIGSGTGAAPVLAVRTAATRAWRVIGRVPAPLSNPDGVVYGYGLDALSGQRAWLWMYRFGDAVGPVEALARTTGLLETVDGGRTWARFTVPGYDIVSPFDGVGWPVQLGPVSVQFLAGHPNVGWLLTSADGAPGGYYGSGTTLWRTTDGGRQWAAVS